MKRESDSCYLNGSRPQQNWLRIQQIECRKYNLIHWKYFGIQFTAYLLINLTIQKTELSTCCIYAPNNPAQQFNLVQTLK